jgi:hypothetical protein
LIGLGTFLTAPYVAKLEASLAQKAVVEPLITEVSASRVLRAVPNHRGFVITCDEEEDLPELTYRQMLDEFHGQWFPPSAPLSGDEAEELEAIYEITPAQLDDIAPPATYEDEWRERNNPTLNAFNFLDDLDLGPEDEEGDDLRGDLRFIEGEHPGSTYIAVEAPDELTLHLLQARLLDLGENVYIRIERAA